MRKTIGSNTFVPERTYKNMSFINWWGTLNNELSAYNQPEALYGEARSWYDGLTNQNLPDHLVRIIINARNQV